MSLQKQNVCLFLITLLVATGIVHMGSAHSPNLDEVGHLAAGVLVSGFGNVDLYKVNPPLVKAIAAIPVLQAQPKYDWSRLRTAPGVRAEWDVGRDFLTANRQHIFHMFATARWSVLVFWIIGVVIITIWARRNGGTVTGAAAAAMWLFNPDIIAWSATICPDAPAASMALFSAWVFRDWIAARHWSSAVLSGVVTGLAVLTKSSLILLVPVYTFLYFIQVPLKGSRKPGNWIAWVIVVGFVINAGYGFSGSFKPLGDFLFFSKTLGGPVNGATLRQRLPLYAGNRYSETVLGEIPVPLPASFVEGLDLQKYDFEEGKWSYLRGEHKFGGWWYWYIYALMVKTPVGTILLFFITCGWALWRVEWKSLARSCLHRFARLSRVARLRPGTPRADAPPLAEEHASVSTEPVLHENLILLAPAVCLFVLVSSQTGFSRYLRYVLPCYPFVFIWMSQIFSEKSGLPAWMRKVCWGLLAWSVFSSLSVFPHSMSYFNELAGGPENGPAHLIDASIDWGQDVLFLADWVKEHPEAKPLYLSLHVFFDPRIAGIDYEHPPYDPRYVRFRQHLTSDRVGPKPGWYAVSVHQLYSRTKEFAYLFDFPKADMVGYSIYLYHLTEQDVENWNRQHAAEIDAASGKPATK